jgi:acetoin utilization deacetylase AcuC-like enzyme
MRNERPCSAIPQSEIRNRQSMRVFYTDRFVLPLPEGHRFPMIKYARVRERCVAEGVLAPGALREPPAATWDELALVHDAEYLARVRGGTLDAAEQRRIGFPWSEGMVERSRRSVGAILDLDVHQGNGTAAIFAADPSVFTVSIHGARNFPFRKSRSSLDIELPDGAGDEVFLAAVETYVPPVLSEFRPDLVVYLAGADPYHDDRFGRLGMTKAGLEQRDRLILGLCLQSGVPVAVTMAGGYARDTEDTVDIHVQTVRVAAELASGAGLGRDRSEVPAPTEKSHGAPNQEHENEA